MEPNNVDKEIKKKLEQREISPSPKSWEQLRSKLDANSNKKTPVYWWLGIAASFTTGAIIVSLLFQNSEPVNRPAVVETQTENVEGFQKPENNLLENTYKPDTVIRAIVDVETEQEMIKKEVVAHQKQATSQNKPEAYANVEEVIKTEDTLLVNQKIEEIIAETSRQELHKESLTEAEIDNLLALAAAEIIKEKQSNKFRNQGSVSATDLLNDVEEELDRSFREKIFDMLKDGFNKTRTAVANRNE